jgi:predicted nuclease of predicted toxin-antitoxin system
VKVLFDANVPAKLRGYLPGHEVTRAQWLGLHELENGDLLAAAEKSGSAVLVTADQNLSYQQNLTGRKLALVVLSTNDWPTIRQAPELAAQAVDTATPGSFQAVRFTPLPRRPSRRLDR